MPAERLAKEDGVSLNQWIAAAVAEKIGVISTAAEFFKKRGQGDRCRTGEIPSPGSGHRSGVSAIRTPVVSRGLPYSVIRPA